METTIKGSVFGVDVNEEISVSVGKIVHHFNTTGHEINYYEDIMPLFLGGQEILITGILKPELTRHNVGVWDTYLYYDFVASDWK